MIVEVAVRVPVVLAPEGRHNGIARDGLELASTAHSGARLHSRPSALAWVALAGSFGVRDHWAQDSDSRVLDPERRVGRRLSELASSNLLDENRLMRQVGVSDLHDRDWPISAPFFRLKHPLMEQVDLLPELFVLVDAVLIDHLDPLLDLRKLSDRILGDHLLIHLLAGAVAPHLDVDR